MQIKKILSNPLVAGTISLTAVGIFTRIIGFLFRIFLSKTIGEEGMGIYQLTVPVIGICMSASALSIQTALSRLIAGYSVRKDRQDRYLLRVSLFAALAMSALFALALYPASDWISLFILKEKRCSELLRMLLLSLPFSCVHTCVCGYYYGQNRTKSPAVSQLIEQIVRIGTIFALWYIRLKNNEPMTLRDIAAGTVISELASALYLSLSYFCEKKEKAPRTLSYRQIARELAATTLPLCSNRVCMTVLQTAESILIPIELRAYGMNTSQALSVFGVLTGMALPFILFPSTLANSASVLLLPKVAADHAAGSRSQIEKAARASLGFCFCLGLFCLVFFLLTGPFLGQFFFQSRLAGQYIQALAWLCPFLYLSITCSSILNGLGKLSVVFWQNFICILLRVASVIFLIPLTGLNGYLTGLLTSQLLLCILHLASLKAALKKS